MAHLRPLYRVPVVTIALLVVASLIIACMPVSPVAEVKAQTQAEGPDMETFWAEYSDSLMAGDAERWIDLWLDDGVQLPPDAPANVGKEAILANIAGALGQISFEDFVIDNEEVTVSDDLAVVRGTYSTNMVPTAGGDPLPVDGKYMSVLMRQPDGNWKLYRDCYNSNVPPATAAEPDVEVVTAEVRTLFDEYGASLGAGDAERWIQLWTEDGVQSPPGAPPNVGRDAIFNDISGAMEAFAFEDMQIDVEEVLVAGDLAVARGPYTVTYVPKDGSDPIFVDGKYTTTFQRQPDGSWRIYRDIFNSNVPGG
ncbi:MAG: YybH family protein [Caldilineaceae bacterium]